jgi:RNA polymerase sigma-70 factor (ECF subfamily)
VRRALQQLDLDYRVVVILRHFHDLSYAEMAEVIGIPEKTVKSRLFSARRELRELLSRTDDGCAGS